MALGTYSQLKTAIETWMARSGDADIVANEADIVTLAESRLNRMLPTRLFQTVAQLTGTVGSRAIALPTDYVTPYALQLTTFGNQIQLKPFVIGTVPLGTTSGTPGAWAINGANINLDVLCDRAHTFLFWYRQSFALSDAAPTNSLLTNYPDVYLQACLVEAETFAKDFEAASARLTLLRQTIDEIAETNARSKAVATLVVDAALSNNNSSPGFFDFTSGT